MDPTQPLRVRLNLNNLLDTAQATLTQSDGQAHDPVNAPHKQVFLWTAFFKIDGDTAMVDERLDLRGTATVVGSPGDHGDLGRTGGEATNNQAIVINIPPRLGRFRTVLKPIPLKVPILGVNNVPAVVGCVGVLWEEGSLSDEALATGHAAFNDAIQSELDKLIQTLSVSKQEPTREDIDAISSAVSDRVESSIKDDLNFWQKLQALLASDKPLGNATFRFSGRQLASALPAGLPIQDQIVVLGGAGDASDANGNPIGVASVTETYQINGTAFCDPFDISLRRFIQSEQLTQAPGLRSLMRPQFDSVRNWTESVLP
jgi:hypothetical protein